MKVQNDRLYFPSSISLSQVTYLLKKKQKRRRVLVETRNGARDYTCSYRLVDNQACACIEGNSQASKRKPQIRY